MGPRILCNACGVPRLFPEYRLGTSPTFISSLHSNSHREILELRKVKTPEEQSVMTAAAMRCQMDLISQTISSKTTEVTSDLTDVAISWLPELPLSTRDGKITKESVKAPAATNCQPDPVQNLRESRTAKEKSMRTVAPTSCQSELLLKLSENTEEEPVMIAAATSCQLEHILGTRGSKSIEDDESVITVAVINHQPGHILRMGEGNTANGKPMMMVTAASYQPGHILKTRKQDH